MVAVCGLRWRCVAAVAVVVFVGVVVVVCGGGAASCYVGVVAGSVAAEAAR